MLIFKRKAPAASIQIHGAHFENIFKNQKEKENKKNKNDVKIMVKKSKKEDLFFKLEKLNEGLNKVGLEITLSSAICLKMVRALNNLTQQELSELIDIPQRDISSLENQCGLPSFSTIKKTMDALNVSFSYLKDLGKENKGE